MDNQTPEMMRFDLPREHSSIIKVIGVGGGGSNAVNYMYSQGIKGVDFMVCNTDAQALDASPVPIKVQLGSTLTEGRGAGSKPEVGRNAAVENLEDVKAIVGNHTTMVFVTAGMGGGTGTGAAPVIARACREMGILTVGIVTVPFGFEGKKRSQQAEEGLSEMREAVDTLLVIRNDKLRELYGNLSLKQAFSHADEVLCTAAKGIAEVITLTGEINVDMNDVNTVMRESGVAIMGSGMASGEGRAEKAVRVALESPLLNDNDITGANFVLLNITYGGDEVKMDEITEITDYIQECAGRSAEVIWGYGQDEDLGDNLCVTVIATGFTMKAVDSSYASEPTRRIPLDLDESSKKELTAKVSSPTETPAAPTYTAAPETADEPYIKSAEEQIVTPPASNIPPAIERPTQEEPPRKLEPEAPEIIKHDLFEDMNPEPPKTIIENTVREEKETPVDSIRFEPKEVEEHPQAPIFRDLNGNVIDHSDALQSTPTDAVNFNPEPVHNESQSPQPSREEMLMRTKEREQRIREIGTRLRTPSGLESLEEEPAYVRRNIRLDEAPRSGDSNISRFTLFGEEDQDGKPRASLREDNSFLHKDVD